MSAGSRQRDPTHHEWRRCIASIQPTCGRRHRAGLQECRRSSQSGWSLSPHRAGLKTPHDRVRRGPSSMRAGNHQHGWEPALARGERPRSLAVLGTRLTPQTAPPQGGGKADTSARHPSPALVRDGAGILTAASRACSVIPFAIARECEARHRSHHCRSARQPEAAAALRSSRSRSRGRAERAISLDPTAGLSRLRGVSAGTSAPRDAGAVVRFVRLFWRCVALQRARPRSATIGDDAQATKSPHRGSGEHGVRRTSRL